MTTFGIRRISSGEGLPRSSTCRAAGRRTDQVADYPWWAAPPALSGSGLALSDYWVGSVPGCEVCPGSNFGQGGIKPRRIDPLSRSVNAPLYHRIVGIRCSISHSDGIFRRDKGGINGRDTIIHETMNIVQRNGHRSTTARPGGDPHGDIIPPITHEGAAAPGYSVRGP